MTAKFYVQAATPDKQALQALFDNLDLLQQHQDLILSNPIQNITTFIFKAAVFLPYIFLLSLCAWGNCCFCGNTRRGNKKIPIFIASPEVLFQVATHQDIGAKNKVLPTNIPRHSVNNYVRRYLSAAPVVRFMKNINRHRFPFPSSKPQI